MVAPPQEVKPRSLLSSFGSSFGSSFKSAIISARRETTRTPVFGGFSKLEPLQVNQQAQSSPLYDNYAQPTSEVSETATSLSNSRKRKLNSPLLGVSFLNEPSLVCGAPIGNSGRFCILPKNVCSTDTHKKKGTSLREIPLSCWVVVLDAPAKPSAYYSPFVTEEDGKNSSNFQTLLDQKLELAHWA